LQSVKLTSGSSEKPADASGQRRVGDERPEKHRRLEALAARHVRHQPRQRRDRQQDLRGAIDNCIAATIPIRDQSPICSSRSRGGMPAVMRNVVM
jgi:hypothetical protein